MSVLETLEICFEANLNGVDARLNALTKQLGGLSGAALEFKGAMQRAGDTWTKALSGGFAKALPALKAQMAGMGAQAAREMGAAAGEIARQGTSLAQAFAAGVRTGTAGARSAARAVSQSARFDGGASQARSAGRALSDGFAAGIRDRSGAVNAAVSAMVGSATKKIRAALSIHSPSKVTYAFGEYFGEGFAGGIAGTMASVERAAGGLSGAAADGLRARPLPEDAASGTGGVREMVTDAVDRALGGVQLTIPLNVDGIKLGEASIRGINAVTRSAGRVLLNI